MKNVIYVLIKMYLFLTHRTDINVNVFHVYTYTDITSRILIIFVFPVILNHTRLHHSFHKKYFFLYYKKIIFNNHKVRLAPMVVAQMKL